MKGKDSVLVVGSVALDDIETPHEKKTDLLGGSATYFSLSARQFADVRLVGVVGRDFPEGHVRLLEERGVDLLGLKREDGLTFRWSGRYLGSMDKRETVRVDLNVLGSFQPRIPEAFRSTPYILLGNASPHTQRITLDQLDAPRFVLLDTMNLWIETEREALEDLLPRVHALCINDEEAVMLAGRGPLAAAIRILLERGPEVIIVKRAQHGATLATREFLFHVPAYSTERVVDPTGAGDSFAGGFLGSLAREGVAPGSLKRSLLYGAVLGSLSVEEFGPARLQDLAPDEIESRYRGLLATMTL